MPKENNKMQVDIDNLIKQNVNDLSSIKELFRKLEELQEKISQIKYINSNLANKLKKEYEELKKIILDENVQTKLTNDIETINSQLDTVVTNSRIVNATFGVAPWWLSDTPNWKIEQDILKNKNIGCEEMYLVIHMDYENDNFVTRELINKQLYAFETCKTNGIDVKILKFHTDKGMRDIFSSKKTEWVEYYKSELTRWLQAFKNKGIEYVTILNEFPTVYTDVTHDDVVHTLASIIKNMGFKLGITTAGIVESLNLTKNNKNLIDGYFVNLYPVISYNMKNSTLEESINSWNIYEPYVIEICKSNKPFFISETGCQDRWEALVNPAIWHWQTTYNESSNGNAPSLMLEGLFKSNIINHCEKVFYWYFDSLWFNSVRKTVKKYIGGKK